MKESGILDDDLLEEFQPINKLEAEKAFTLQRGMIINEGYDAERGDTIIGTGAKPVGKIYGINLFRMYNVDKQMMMICSGHDIR